MPVGFKKLEFLLYVGKSLFRLCRVIVNNGQIDNGAELKQLLLKELLFWIAGRQQQQATDEYRAQCAK